MTCFNQHNAQFNEFEYHFACRHKVVHLCFITDAILKVVFWLYLGAVLADQCEIWNRNEASHADIGHMTKAVISANSRWWTAAILKIELFQYLSRELSDFDEIWYTDTNFHSEHANLTRKIEFFQIQDGGRTPY